MGFEVYTPIAGIEVVYVAVANGTDSGALTAASANTVTWTAPGDALAGAAVTIAAGETKTVYGNASVTKYVRVKRTSTDDLSGGPAVVTGDGMKATSDLIIQVQTAIDEIETNAQASGSANENVRRAELQALYNRLEQLKRQLARESGGAVARADLRGNFDE